MHNDPRQHTDTASQVASTRIPVAGPAGEPTGPTWQAEAKVRSLLSELGIPVDESKAPKDPIARHDWLLSLLDKARHGHGQDQDADLERLLRELLGGDFE